MPRAEDAVFVVPTVRAADAPLSGAGALPRWAEVWSAVAPSEEPLRPEPPAGQLRAQLPSDEDEPTRPEPSSAELLWAEPVSAGVDEVARAYTADGLAGLSRTHGPWAAAFAVPGSTDVLVAHDPTGVMQLYWAPVPGGVAVSARLPDIAEHPGVDTRPDLAGIAMRYTGGGIDGGWLGMSMTDFTGVHRVTFGHGIRIAADGTVRQVKFWDPATATSSVTARTSREWAAALIDAIDVAVAHAATTAATGPQGTLAVESGYRPVLPAAVLEHRSDALVYTRNAAMPEGSGDVQLISPDPSLPYVRWATEVDFHRFPSRGRDTVVPLIVTAATNGITDLIVDDGAALITRLGSVAGLLRHGHFVEAVRVARLVGHDGPRGPLIRGAKSLARPAVRRARLVRARLRDATWRGDRAGGNPSNPPPADGSGSALLARSLHSETSQRWSSTSSRGDVEAGWMSGAIPRTLEAKQAYAGVFGVRLHAPMMDVRVVELLLTMPDEVWAHGGTRDWVATVLEQRWPALVSAHEAVGARVPPTDFRGWTVNDPAVSELLCNRPQRTGPTVDPRDWPLRPGTT